MAIAIGITAWRAGAPRRLSGARAASGPIAIADSDSDAARAASAKPNETRPASAPRVATASGPSIRGIVLDPDGKPVAGALVVASPVTETRIFDANDRARRPASARDATSGPDGRFEVPLADAALVSLVYVDARGFCPWLERGHRAGEDLTVRLAKSWVLEGTVRALDGTPVAGARVRWIGVAEGISVRRDATTDPAGRFQMMDVVPEPGPRRSSSEPKDTRSRQQASRRSS